MFRFKSTARARFAFTLPRVFDWEGRRFAFTLPRVFEWEGRRFAGEGPPLAEARPSREAREVEDGLKPRRIFETKHSAIADRFARFNRRLTALALYCAAVTLAAAAVSGCVSLDDWATIQDDRYELTQRLRAKSEYRRAGKPGRGEYRHDFKRGWLDGFYDVATGGPCCPPVIAPQRYWSPDDVLENCDAPRAAYYAGWRHGAARSSQFPDTHHLRLHETSQCYLPRCERRCGEPGVTRCGCGIAGGCGGACGTSAGSVSTGWGGLVSDESLLESNPAPPLAPVVVEDIGVEDVGVEDLRTGPATEQRAAAGLIEDPSDPLSLPEDSPTGDLGPLRSTPARPVAPAPAPPSSPARPQRRGDAPHRSPRSLSDENRAEAIPMSEDFEFLPLPARPVEPDQPFRANPPKSLNEQIDDVEDTISIPLRPARTNMSGSPTSIFPGLDWRSVDPTAAKTAAGSRR